MYQERHGWERPGWFVPDAVAEVIMAHFCPRDNITYHVSGCHATKTVLSRLLVLSSYFNHDNCMFTMI